MSLPDDLLWRLFSELGVETSSITYKDVHKSLPDDLWRRILELGVETSTLTYKDVCCLSMTSRRLNRLSKEDVIWSKLLSSDFHSHSPSSTSHTPKSIYRIRFKERAVRRLEFQIHEHKTKVEKIGVQFAIEKEKFISATDELKKLKNVRESSTKLKVWQPTNVQGLERFRDPVISRINFLEMETKRRRRQTFVFMKDRYEERKRVEAVEERLSKIKYGSSRSLEGGSRSNGDDESRKCRKILEEFMKRVVGS